ncbi:MAG: ATPase [Nitrospirae bacterium CG18_big_fil_WC_8_21_14_2_50_70_55]|nr:V-type ATP synthase subunit A [Deltaproteobacteria bacterium]PIQ04344.1 MAG: ATPase [Nitrospirae bacterium CG18_big_fil_WC_8_21_14_2_50_70_55]PIU79059.1 MAG: ATPase [Nitrospirae bacterium CG06_land_8_20_14_3_00_70_43]PIW82448.1 MAG: ATPase [Nitrospirae bacterium CG_4_8_14_3_um_filter_70_85]PIX83554.1 MAG: ATPase [Nitrospirae bacterium CG_4_10_14_3_um_filter_70_108]PJB95460.1 MAG: ATPase [Nitrospirae bacterium CG_4_9_14_0_8_um_filter_70_14]HBB40561.1 ATPase [Pseudomonadota bacterium]
MNLARVTWVGGPVVRARPEAGFAMREAVRVGEAGLLGEVVRLERQEIVVQVYEETTGLAPGARVVGNGSPLAVRLSPGLLGRIFDGLLRPLVVAGDPFVHAGTPAAVAPPLAFTPTLRAGDHLAPGHPFGAVTVVGGRILPALAPPRLAGEVVRVAAAGAYRDDEVVCTVRTEGGEEVAVSLAHPWSVREPRPVAARLVPDAPLVTGQRIIDTFLPVARGASAAIPGGFGTGKTVLLESLAKGCDADVIVYVGCGERGNELAGLLAELPELPDPRTGGPLIERSVIIANTSNMPVAAREASIYTGVTVAEYFRDMGLNVAVMADSTSRWAEALREVSGRLGELPGEAGYPSYLSSRLADFYERAARVRTLSGAEGSVTLLGAVSPPSGDMEEPVVVHTRRYVRALWVLDTERAHARFYPAIHPLTSYSEEAPRLAAWWHAHGQPHWEQVRSRLLTLLEAEQRLARMARILGAEALPAAQRLILVQARLVNEALLRQSAFSAVDAQCPPERQAAMTRVVVRFLDLAEEALACGVAPETMVGLPTYLRLLRMGEEVAGEEAFGALNEAVEQDFVRLGCPAGRVGKKGVER